MSLIEMPQTLCPKCMQWVEDFDGFGVLYHKDCGYCSHPAQSMKDGKWICDVCLSTLTEGQPDEH